MDIIEMEGEVVVSDYVLLQKGNYGLDLATRETHTFKRFFHNSLHKRSLDGPQYQINVENFILKVKRRQL